MNSIEAKASILRESRAKGPQQTRLVEPHKVRKQAALAMVALGVLGHGCSLGYDTDSALPETLPSNTDIDTGNSNDADLDVEIGDDNDTDINKDTDLEMDTDIRVDTHVDTDVPLVDTMIDAVDEEVMAIICGNSSCEDGENPVNCVEDCPDTCGDGLCTGSEVGGGACPADCPCGDGVCSLDENNANCEIDCPACTTCGDGTCEGHEANSNCPADCDLPEENCGNTFCDFPSEDQDSCAVDCAPNGGAWICGDGSCTTAEGENWTVCAEDCSFISSCGGKDVDGDGNDCDSRENCENCSQDCGQCLPEGEAVCE